MKILIGVVKRRNFHLGCVVAGNRSSFQPGSSIGAKICPAMLEVASLVGNGPSGRMQLSIDPAVSDHLCSIKKESQWYT